MKIYDFLEELAFFFPLKGSSESIQRVFDTYVENLEGLVVERNQEYDFKKVLQSIQRERDYKTFPTLSEIIKHLNGCEVETKTSYKADVNEGKLLIVTLPNGYKYQFQYSGIGKELKILKDDLFRRFGECKYDIYPVGTVIIGDKIFLPEGV